MLADVLRAAGGEPQVATTGGEAIAIARRTRPDAALVDWVLPDMDGRALMQALKEARPGIQVAVVSGLAAGSIPDTRLADAVFPKPTDTSQLTRFLGLT